MVHIIPVSEGCFTSFIKLSFFTFSFLLFVVNEHKTTSSSSPSMAFSAFSNFHNCHTSAPNSPYSYSFPASVVAYPIEVSVFIVTYFCFLIFFFFFIFIFNTFLIPRFVLYLPDFVHCCLYCLLYAPRAISFFLLPLFYS